MTFLNTNLIIPIIMSIFVFGYFYFRIHNKYYSWVKDHWFFKKSIFANISMFCYFVGLSLLLVALMDLRGPEKRIKGNKVEQKTIILVDSSGSMLAEDVRPNRFQKALLLVKHYVKKSVGQKISLVVFSDSQKRIVPFTEDKDLIQARIDRLETLELKRGGTGLSQAIQESIQYFLNSSDEIRGNILIFTDAEETDLGLEIKIPDSVSVGLVGVGTRKGAPIPIRNSRGVSMGKKKHNGKLVISKLDEDFIKSLSGKIKNFKYWIATSYSLPTEEIINFFNRIHEVKESEQEFRVRPIYSNYLIVPGIIFLIISFVLKYSRILVPVSMLLLFPTIGLTQLPSAEEKKEPEKSQKTLDLEDEFAQGDLPEEGQKALAYNLLNDGFPKLSKQLYEEIIQQKEINAEDVTMHINLAVSEVLVKERSRALMRFRDIINYLNNLEQTDEVLKVKETVTKNVLKALEQQGDGSGKGKDQQKDKKQDQNNNNQQSNGQSSDNQKQQDQKNDSESKSDDQKQSDQNNSQNKNDQKKNKENKQKNTKKLAKKKVPAILKQLLNDDNQLQKRVIDAETTKRKKRDQKDW